MSKQQHYQVQYVAKDSYDAKKDAQPYKKYYNNNNNHEYGYSQRTKKSNRSNYQNDSKPKIEYEQKQQINQPHNNVYDAKSLISAFQEKQEPPEDIIHLIQKIPQLFTSKPFKPFNPSLQHNQSDEEEPEWMQSSEFNGTFQLNDIEVEMQGKRELYQKNHGTFDKKQEERTKKQSDQAQSQIQINEIEMEKQKYREKREQEQKQDEAADETKAKLFELFTISQQQQLPEQPPITKILTVEQIEQEALRNKTTQIKEDQTKAIQIVEQQNEECFDELEKILGFKLNGNVIQEQTIAPKKEDIFDVQTIKTSPFQIQADLHSKKANENLWFYVDKYNKIQGPFPTKNMDIWFSQNYLKSNLMISWMVVGKWIYLEQFQHNLELIHQGLLDKSKAMDPTTIESLKQCKPSQNNSQQISYNNQNYNSNTNHHANRFQPNNYNYSQQQSQYNQSYGQSYQYNQQTRNRNNQGRTIFQIGQKDQSQYNNNYNQPQYYESSEDGLILDSKNFPTLDEK